MTRVKRGVSVGKRHKKVVLQTKGYYGRSKNCYRLALTRLEKALQYAYRDRRRRKRDFRRLWIQRINAAARIHGMNYSQFMGAFNKSGIEMNRMTLSELAIMAPESFSLLVQKVSEVGGVASANGG